MCFVDRVYKLTRLQKGIVYGGEPLQVIEITVIIIHCMCVRNVSPFTPIIGNE